MLDTNHFVDQTQVELLKVHIVQIEGADLGRRPGQATKGIGLPVYVKLPYR